MTRLFRTFSCLDQTEFMAAPKVDPNGEYYAALGLQPDATIEDIKRCYKKLAKKYHPDKNKGDKEKEKAEKLEKWHKISKAYEILGDEKLKEEYDVIAKKKVFQQKRKSELNANIKKMRDDLDAQEEAARKERDRELTEARQHQQEVERLREANRQNLEKIRDKEKTQLQQTKSEPSGASAALKISWDLGVGDYTEERLKEIFRMFGDISLLVIKSKKKRGLALLEFKSGQSAHVAIQQRLGTPENILKIEWAFGGQKTPLSSPGFSSPSSAKASTPSELDDLESQVFGLLPQKKMKTDD
jgi:DnaJ family protein C protein 17